MFTDNPNIEKIVDGIWIYRNFVSEEENELISRLMLEHEQNNIVDPFAEESHAIDWYKDKQGPVLEELKNSWDMMSDLLYPEHYIHPQLAMTVQKPGDEGMFVHSDSPGENMEEQLTQMDRWTTCCIISHGIVLYFGDFTGGEIFYPHFSPSGERQESNHDSCLEIDVRPRDLVIHGSVHPYEHGVRRVHSGVRYSFSNFAMEKHKAPGTFPLYDPEVTPLIKCGEDLAEWNTEKPLGTYK